MAYQKMGLLRNLLRQIANGLQMAYEFGMAWWNGLRKSGMA